MSIVFITHDLADKAENADRVLVMYKGKIVEQGNVMDIFTNPKHPYTKGLLACRPPLGKRLKSLPVISDFMQEDVEGNLQEKASSVQSVIDARVMKEEEVNARHEKLISQPAARLQARHGRGQRFRK